MDFTFAVTVGPWGGAYVKRPASNPRLRLRIVLGFVAVTVGVGDAYLVTDTERDYIISALDLAAGLKARAVPPPPPAPQSSCAGGAA